MSSPPWCITVHMCVCFNLSIVYVYLHVSPFWGTYMRQDGLTANVAHCTLHMDVGDAGAAKETRTGTAAKKEGEIETAAATTDTGIVTGTEVLKGTAERVGIGVRKDIGKEKAGTRETEAAGGELWFQWQQGPRVAATPHVSHNKHVGWHDSVMHAPACSLNRVPLKQH